MLWCLSWIGFLSCGTRDFVGRWIVIVEAIFGFYGVLLGVVIGLFMLFCMLRLFKWSLKIRDRRGVYSTYLLFLGRCFDLLSDW